MDSLVKGTHISRVLGQHIISSSSAIEDQPAGVLRRGIVRLVHTSLSVCSI